MSVTTLEEVFLRVANGTADVEARKNLANISLKRQSSLSSTNFKTGPAKARALGFVCPKGVQLCKQSMLTNNGIDAPTDFSSTDEGELRFHTPRLSYSYSVPLTFG